MSRDKPTNLVASVLARLRNNSLSAGLPFQQVLRSIVLGERFDKQWKAGDSWLAMENAKH